MPDERNGLDRMLDMQAADVRDLLATTQGLAFDFLSTLPQRHVGTRASAEEMRAWFATPLPGHGDSPAEVLRALAAPAERGHMANAGPRFFGFVIGGTLPVAIGADWLASAWDQNPGLFVLSPIVSVVEEVTAGWICDLLGLPSTASVGFVTGCQMAHVTSLAAARHAVLQRSGWDVGAQGLRGAPRVRIVVGGEAHITITRALRLLGFGTDDIEVASADEQGRMLPEALARVLGANRDPAIVCAQVGNVNTGARDPVREIIRIAHAAGAWAHVDGAFGLWAAASPQHRHLTDGAGDADSWATDAHKWLNVPQDSGIAIVRDSNAHRAAMTTDAAYMVKSAGAERDPVDWVPEFSRRARSLAVYAALRALGRRGVAQLVQNCCDRARRMAALLGADARVEILNDVDLNQVLVRFHAHGDSGDLTRAVIARVQQDGTCWLGGTTWRDTSAMRLSFVNWSTTDADVVQSAAAILRCLDAEVDARAAM